MAGLNLVAASRVHAICEIKGLPSRPAPTEAEAQLTWSRYDLVYANDSDYIVNGCGSVMFADGQLWGGAVQHYQRDRLDGPPGAGGDKRLNDAVADSGLQAIQTLALLAGNDYFDIPGVAAGTVPIANALAPEDRPHFLATYLSVVAGVALLYVAYRSAA